MAGENIIQGAIGGAKWGAAIGFGLGFLAPFATTFLAPPTISFLMNMGAGASIFFGSVGAAESFHEGHVAQGFFRLGMGFLGAAAMRYGATRPMKPVNIGGEGEVPEAINLQGRWALGRHFGRSQPTPKGEPAGQNLAGMLAEGHEFVIYNADTEVLPFTTDSVPRVYTNSVLIDAPMGIYPRILSSEIKRVLQSGGQWFVDGVLYFTKP